MFNLQYLKSVLFSILILTSFFTIAQLKRENIQLKIVPKLGCNYFELGNKYLHNSDSIQFETVKFYISNIELMLNGKATYKEKASYHLIDFSKSNSLSILLQNSYAKKFDAIKFCIGIDSTTSVSGAFGADLDPINAMYWTWQNGYIHIKLEGNIFDAQQRNKNTFEYHIGGYEKPNNTLQQINFEIEHNNNLEIEVDLEKMLTNFDVEKQTKIMSPCADAVKFATLFSKAFNLPKSK